MPTHEFTFPGGHATITTETGGTDESPDFCLELGDEVLPFIIIQDPDHHLAASIFAAEILRLAAFIDKLEKEREMDL